MILTKCPACSNEVEVPDSFLGKKVRCRNPECRKGYAVVPQAPAPEPQAATDSEIPIASADSQSEFQFVDNSGGRSGGGRSRRSSRTASDHEVTQQTQTDRYPNLERYLKWARLAALLQLICCMLLVAITAATTVIGPMLENTPMRTAIVQMLLGLLTSALVGFASFMVYVFTMAGVELIQLLIDIESNTRNNQSIRLE